MRTFYWHEKKDLDFSRFILWAAKKPGKNQAFFIGVTRLELAASSSLTKRSTT